MIKLYSGTPGSGKSYHAAVDVYDRLRQGKPVISNTTYNMKYIQLKNREKFTYIDNSDLTVDFLEKYAFENHKPGREGQTLLIIDECAVMFNSREYSRNDRMRWITFLQQHRKLGFNITLISQSDRMIDRQIRAFIEYDVKHRNAKNFHVFGFFLSLFFGGSLFTCVTYWYGIKERVNMEFLRYRRKIAKFYNTYQIFNKQDSTPTLASNVRASAKGEANTFAGVPFTRRARKKAVRRIEQCSY